MDVTYLGVSFFEVLFRDLATWLATLAEVDCGSEDLPATWTFPSLWLCLWRSVDEAAVERKLRKLGGYAGLFVEQVSVDARFATAKKLAKLGGAPIPPPRIALGRDDEEAVRNLWREIGRREAAGERFLGIVEQLRTSCEGENGYRETRFWRRLGRDFPLSSRRRGVGPGSAQGLLPGPRRSVSGPSP